MARTHEAMDLPEAQRVELALDDAQTLARIFRRWDTPEAMEWMIGRTEKVVETARFTIPSGAWTTEECFENELSIHRIAVLRRMILGHASYINRFCQFMESRSDDEEQKELTRLLMRHVAGRE